MAISKTYSAGIYILDNGIYEVWHNGRYIARVTTPEEAEELKQIAKDNGERGNPLAGVLAARQFQKQKKIKNRVEKRRARKVGATRKNATANDIEDLANWLYQNTDVSEETPQIFSKLSTQGALEIQLDNIRKKSEEYIDFDI